MRAIVVSIVALVALFQSFAALGQAYTNLAPANPEANAVVSTFDASCGANRFKDHKAPGHGGLGCFECCVLCGELSTPAVIHATELHFPRPRRITSVAQRALDHNWVRPAGWASSWSSRAPPSFS